MSRSFGFNLQKTKSDDEDTVSTYEADRIGLNYSYGLPMTEDNRFYLQLIIIEIILIMQQSEPDEILDFITKSGIMLLISLLKFHTAIDTREIVELSKVWF